MPFVTGIAGDRAIGKISQLQIADHAFAQFGHQRPPSVVEYPQTTRNATGTDLPRSGLVQVDDGLGSMCLDYMQMLSFVNI
jgi:hypothetical protein